MFLEFYKMREQPFGITPDPRFLYLSRTHCEALASLFYGIETRRGFTALIAKPGMGKTTLLFQLLERLRKSSCAAFLFQTQCNSRELFRYLLAEMGLEHGDEDLVTMHQKLNQALIRVRDAGMQFVLIIDEAQNLEPSVLETVRLLSDFESPGAKLLQIILAGQPQLAVKLAQPSLAQLRQRVSILARLEPLSVPETRRYIDCRLQVAGYDGPPLFTADALDLIAARSEGIPRNINNLSFNTLSLGYALGRKRINADIVQEALADLDFEGDSQRNSIIALPQPAGRPPAWHKLSGLRWARQATYASLAFLTVFTMCVAFGARQAVFLDAIWRGIGGATDLAGMFADRIDRTSDFGAKPTAGSTGPTHVIAPGIQRSIPSAEDNRSAQAPGTAEPAGRAAAGYGAPETSPHRSSSFVIVRRGQTLWQITGRYLGRQSWAAVRQICRLNPALADSNHIVAGQRIELPAPPVHPQAKPSSGAVH